MSSRVIEEEAGTTTGARCRHDGYWAGDLSQFPVRGPRTADVGASVLRRLFQSATASGPKVAPPFSGEQPAEPPAPVSFRIGT